MSKPTSSGAKPRVLRKLGHLYVLQNACLSTLTNRHSECFQTAIYALEWYCGTMVTCSYGIPPALRGPAAHGKLVDHLELAVADTIGQHPLLQVGLVNEASKRPAWVQLDSVDLAHHIRWREVEDAEKYPGVRKDAVMHQLDDRFEDIASRPGWRVIVLKRGYDGLMDVMFSWNHSNTDGTGGKIFHQTLLQSLNRVADDDYTGSLPKLKNHVCPTNVTRSTLTPPQNHIAKFRVTPGYAAATIWKELGPSGLKSSSKRAPEIAHWGTILLTSRETQIRQTSVDHTTLQRALAACRRNKTTLTGLLHGVALVSLAPQLPGDQVAGMVGETPLNLRRFVERAPKKYPGLEPSRMVGNFVTKIDHEFDKELVVAVRGMSLGAATDDERFVALQDAVWSAAASTRREIKDKLDLGLKNDAVGLMAAVGDWQKYFRDGAKKPRHGSWLVTNVGVIESQPAGAAVAAADAAASGDDSEWRLRESSFSLSASALAAMFTISTIAVQGGDLGIDVSWQDHVVDVGIGERLCEDLKAWLNYVGRE